MTAFSYQFAADLTCFSRPSPSGGALPSTPCEPTHPGLPRASRRTKENLASELTILASGIWNILVYSLCTVAPYIYICVYMAFLIPTKPRYTESSEDGLPKQHMKKGI